MRLIGIGTLVLAGSTGLFGQTAEAPTIEEVARQLPPDPHALDFLLLGWSPGAYIGTSGQADRLVQTVANPETGNPVLRVGIGVTAPRPVKSPDPHYSKQARKEKIQGSVVLWVVVGPDGIPENIRVVRSLGHGLDEEAIKAMRQWRFQPATKDGQPVTVQINVEMHFRMRW